MELNAVPYVIAAGTGHVMLGVARVGEELPLLLLQPLRKKTTRIHPINRGKRRFILQPARAINDSGKLRWCSRPEQAYTQLCLRCLIAAMLSLRCQFTGLKTRDGWSPSRGWRQKPPRTRGRGGSG